MSIRDVSRKSSEKNLMQVRVDDSLAGVDGERLISESSIYMKRRRSTYPSVVIEEYAPERFFRAEFHQLMDDVGIKEIHNYEKSDARDLPSREPSYTKEFFGKFTSLECYNEAQRRYGAQFKREIELLAEYQPTAYDVMSFYRHMAYTTLWPPLHNRRELKRSERLFFPYTKKEKRRLQLLLCSRN